MKNELISIIIPLFNREDFIIYTLESLKAQTYQEWEALVIDDGSDDDGPEKVIDFMRSEPRVEFIKRERDPKGAPTCRNIGLESAKGQNILFLDSDDLLHKDCLINRIKFIKVNPTLDFAVFQGAIFHHQVGDSKIIINKFTKEADLPRFLRGDMPWLISSVLWRAEVLKRQLRFDESLLNFQDWDLHVNALVHGLSYKKFDSLPDNFIRQHSSNRLGGKGDLIILKSRKHLFDTTVRKLKRKNKLSKENRLNISVAYFYLSLYLIKCGHLNEALSGWKSVKILGLLPYEQYIFCKLYLETYAGLELENRTKLRKIVNKGFSIVIPKEILHRKRTFQKISSSF